jgi:integrase
MQDYMLLRGKIMLGADEQPAEPRRRRSHRVSELGAQPVFARHDRGAGWKQVKPLSSHAIENLLWELVEETGLDVVITPHKFRHWFATKMLAATADLATTQDLLGHSNPATTRIYAQVSEKKKQSAHQQVFGE